MKWLVWVIPIAQKFGGQLPLSVREDADDKLKRLYRLIEDGMTVMDDVLKGWDSGFADVYRNGALDTIRTCDRSDY